MSIIRQTIGGRTEMQHLNCNRYLFVSGCHLMCFWATGMTLMSIDPTIREQGEETQNAKPSCKLRSRECLRPCIPPPDSCHFFGLDVCLHRKHKRALIDFIARFDDVDVKQPRTGRLVTVSLTIRYSALVSIVQMSESRAQKGT